MQFGRKISVVFFLLFELCLSAQIYYVDADDTKVIQVINDTTVLAKLGYNGRWDSQLICVTEIPTQNLVDDSKLLSNARGDVLLVADGTYTYVSVMGGSNKVRKFTWPDPERIKKEIQTATKTETKECDKCHGEGRLEKSYKGQLGRKICPQCGGEKTIKRKTKYDIVKVWLDGNRVK